MPRYPKHTNVRLTPAPSVARTFRVVTLFQAYNVKALRLKARAKCVDENPQRLGTLVEPSTKPIKLQNPHVAARTQQVRPSTKEVRLMKGTITNKVSTIAKRLARFDGEASTPIATGKDGPGSTGT